jgi:hypothetical protein
MWYVYYSGACLRAVDCWEPTHARPWRALRLPTAGGPRHFLISLVFLSRLLIVTCPTLTLPALRSRFLLVLPVQYSDCRAVLPFSRSSVCLHNTAPFARPRCCERSSLTSSDPSRRPLPVVALVRRSSRSRLLSPLHHVLTTSSTHSHPSFTLNSMPVTAFFACFTLPYSAVGSLRAVFSAVQYWHVSPCAPFLR